MLEKTQEQMPVSGEFDERYVVNSVGERVEVILTINAFEQLVAELHELREKENLHAEMIAWDTASDEALSEFERTLP